MRRLLILLFMLAVGLTNAAAAPLALCQHSSAASHVAALESTDASTAAAAHSEEAAAAAAEKQGSLADVAASALSGVLLPGGMILPSISEATALPWRPAESGQLTGRTVAPLLDPPLA